VPVVCYPAGPRVELVMVLLDPAFFLPHWSLNLSFFNLSFSSTESNCVTSDCAKLSASYAPVSDGMTMMTRPCIRKKDLLMHCTLGMGRFGRVRLVQHNTTGTTYALKMIGRRLVVEAGQESHLQNEVTVMKHMRHPFCTNLFATYVDSRYFYMLIEVISGGELLRVLEQAPEGRLTNAASCFYAANVVCALEYLHKQDVIFRDLKPENLMVDAVGFLKMVDFGFAKRVYGRTYTLCGTVDYLAPEIVSRQGHGFEVDLWALGVLSYEMLVGCPPFEGQTKVGTGNQITTSIIQDRPGNRHGPGAGIVKESPLDCTGAHF